MPRRSRLRRPSPRKRARAPNPQMPSDQMKPLHRKIFRPRAAWAAFAFVMLLAGECAAQSTMSGVPNAMQGFSQNRDQPIQIDAASLEMRDKKKEATFSGNVKVVQGDTTMTSKTLVVFYESSSGQSQSGSSQSQPATTANSNAKAAKGTGAPMQSATPGPGGASSIK